MIKIKKNVSNVMVMSLLIATLFGCQKQEGPAEQAGKEVDKVTEQVGQKLEDAGQNIQDTAKGDKK